MEKKRTSAKNEAEPTIANGIDNDEELDAKATEEEIRRGESTKVTKLVYDEYDSSSDD